jgi:hypothetical protein
MALPPIAPTGAMASGEYVDYMMQYNSDAETYIEGELPKYMTASTMADWDNKWNRILADVASEVVVLGAAVQKMSSQVRMIADAVSKK